MDLKNCPRGDERTSHQCLNPFLMIFGELLSLNTKSCMWHMNAAVSSMVPNGATYPGKL